MQRLMFGITLFLSVGTLNAEVNFLKGTFADALREATRLQKPVMVDFTTDWCRWCDTLDVHTYADDSVALYVNDQVVPIKIDAEKGEGIEIAKKYSVQGYPTILVLKADGEEIDRMLGYIEPRTFLATLKDYVHGENTIGLLTTRVSEHPEDAALRYAIAKKYADRNDMATASMHFQKLLDLDPHNALGHGEEAQFTVAVSSLRAKKDPERLTAFLESFPQSDKKHDALYMLWRFYIKEKDGAQGRKYFAQYIETWPADAAMMNNYALTCAENRVNLEHAEETIRRAVELASNDEEKAAFIDTHAAVRFARGDTKTAITLEEKALGLLKKLPHADTKPYEEALSRFRAATKSASPH